MNDADLVTLISDFVQTTPPEIIEAVVSALENYGAAAADLNRSALLASIHNPLAKSKLSKILDCWIQETSNRAFFELALAVRSSFKTLEMARKSLVELVWTGPKPFPPLRRTDQALLELINTAEKRLVLVSFAVYKVQAVLDAVENAIMRNVNVIICLEGADSSLGKISFSGIKAFSSSIFHLATFYCWPIENRPLTEDGKHGSLHAKLAVADREKVFISSANLTEYAMDLNIEMGLLVEVIHLGEQVDNLINELIIQRIFKKITI